MVQSAGPYLYVTTGKTIALTRWTFVGKVVSLLFNTLSRFVSKKFSLQEAIVFLTVTLRQTQIYKVMCYSQSSKKIGEHFTLNLYTL